VFKNFNVTSWNEDRRPFDEETLFSLGEVIEQAAGRFVPAKWW